MQSFITANLKAWPEKEIRRTFYCSADFSCNTSVILAGGGRLGCGYAVFCGCRGSRCFTVYGGGDGGGGSAGSGACSQSKNHNAHKQKYKKFFHD